MKWGLRVSIRKNLGTRSRIFHELMPLGDWLSSGDWRSMEHGW